MLGALTRNWWVLLLEGIVAVLFGIVAFARPTVALLTLVLLYALWALVDGFLAIWLGIASRRDGDRWWAILLIGVVSVLAGLAAITWPGITVAVLLALVAAWAIVRGVLALVAAVRLRHEIEGEWLLALSGLLSMLLGVALVAWPGAGVLAIVWLLGAYALLSGIALVALALRVRRVHRTAARLGV